jgi:type IX secretion system PorP/SprF family membrane protein
MKNTFYKVLTGVLWLLGATATGSYAQREVLYEQYQQNPMAINPAFTGIREDFNMTVLLRRRWFFLPNSPITQTFAADGTVAGGKVGLGLQALNDRMSNFATTGAYGSVAYHLADTGPVRLSVGVQGGVNVLPVFDFTSNTSLNRALGSVGVGVWLRGDRWYAGISKPEVLKQGYGSRSAGAIYRRPLYLLAGLQHELGDNLLLVPQVVVVQEAGTRLRLDAGARLWAHERVGIGASYRRATRNIVQLTAELQVSPGIRVGYGYNSRAVETGIFFTGTAPAGMHELMLKFVPDPSGFHLN